MKQGGYKKVIALALALGPLSAWADIAVIVNPGYSATSATADDLSKVFLGKADTIGGGAHLTPLDQPEGNASRTAFYEKVCNKNAAQLNAYWSRLIFTGQGQPPKVIEGGDAAVVDAVAKSADAIGYVSSTAVTASVKVLATFPN
ncbi:MAG TPA: phosphate ABC transporter substrate-binding protein [Pseudomonadales bacterium]|nr:phosphate ABC transporter substrate-binding protein [Pseudomonadales bacterium]